jgi:hypothetical protein
MLKGLNVRIAVLLNDGETFSDAQGCRLIPIPEMVAIMGDVEDHVTDPESPGLPIGPITNQADVIKYMGIFFPKMILDEDNGELVIHTGIIADET